MASCVPNTWPNRSSTDIRVNDIDKWIAAKRMIDMFGDNAGLQAAMRADHVFDQGDRERIGVRADLIGAL